MKKFNRYTVTAALPYVNGPKHIGHLAGAYLPSDIYVRYLRSRGEDVVFVCGSDELGTAITMQAHKEKVSPKELVDKYHELSKFCFEKFNISFDIYHRTTEKLHFDTASEFFKDFYDKGLFEEKTVNQYYDEELNQFLADRYIKGTCPNCDSENAYGDQCENCGKSLDALDLKNPISALTGNKPILKETKNWYFKLGDYENWITKWLLEGKKGKWKANTYGQAKSWIDHGLQSRSMTRDGDWGVPVPLKEADGKVLYVWFDAPIGYISATKQWAIDNNKEWEPYWKSEDTKLVHFVGKDNIVFHCIIFPMMLQASSDYILPEDVPANEFLNLEGQKMSTSKRWSLEMIEYIEALPERIDEMRYCLIANMPENKDSDFSWKDYQLKVNSELVAIVGNFVNRIFVLTHKFFDGKIPEATECSELKEFILTQKNKIQSSIENYSFREAMFETMALARHGNKILTEKEPWKTFKTDPNSAGIILYDCLQIIATLSIALEPFMPNAAMKLKDKMNLDDSLGWEDITRSDIIKVGEEIKDSFYLFEKIDDVIIDKQIEYLENKSIDTNSSNHKPYKEMINFEDFTKLDIRIGTIKTAEKVEKTDKLLKFSVDMGSEVRTIVSGVAHIFSPEEMIGKQVQVLCNLEPRKIRGVESQGMILFAENGEKLSVMSPQDVVSNGSSVN